MFALPMDHFSVYEKGVKTGSECSPKLEVLQDSAFETNVVYEVNFQTVYLPIDLIFPIRYSLHFSFIRLSPIVFYPLKSDAVRLIVTVENSFNRYSSIHRLRICIKLFYFPNLTPVGLLLSEIIRSPIL